MKPTGKAAMLPSSLQDFGDEKGSNRRMQGSKSTNSDRILSAPKRCFFNSRLILFSFKTHCYIVKYIASLSFALLSLSLSLSLSQQSRFHHFRDIVKQARP